jgi:hypothetical protein
LNDSILALLSTIVLDTDDRMQQPLTKASVHIPVRSMSDASLSATRGDEQAVSTDKLGAFSPNTKDIRLEIIAGDVPSAENAVVSIDFSNQS